MVSKIISRIIFAAGILCFVLPFTMQGLDKVKQESVIETYEKEIEFVENQEIVECLEQAKKYNKFLHELQENTFFKGEQINYEEQLNLSKTGMMGHVEIPRIDVKLPVYHGTTEDVLSSGVGHLEGTSLPVGGANSHAILTGHSGLPSAELFTRLDELETGDEFYLKICKEVLRYEVEEIQVVEPDEVESLAIKSGKDLVSLVTCTPYGINTHRLIVTGERMEEMVLEEKEGGINEKVYYFTVICASVILYVGYRGVRRRRKNSSCGK